MPHSEERRPWDRGGRDWSDVATSRGRLGPPGPDGGRKDPPPEASGGPQPHRHWESDPVLLISDSGLQNRAIINCCFKLLSLYFVTAALRH